MLLESWRISFHTRLQLQRQASIYSPPPPPSLVKVEEPLVKPKENVVATPFPLQGNDATLEPSRDTSRIGTYDVEDSCQ